jgi:hypothetical protein
MSNIIDDHGAFWWRSPSFETKVDSFERAVVGRLLIAEDGSVSLELHDVLSDEKRFVHRMLGGEFDQDENLVIQGILKASGQHVMLLGAYADGGSVSFGGISYEKYRADLCLVGNSKFPEDVELKFSSLYIDFKGYEEWLGMNSLVSKQTARSFHVSYKKPKTLIYKLAGSRRAEIKSFLSGQSYGDDRLSSIRLIERVGVEIHSPIPLSVNDHLKEYQVFYYFMYLLTGSNYNLQWPQLKIKKRKSVPSWCTVYKYRNVGLPSKPSRHSSWLSFDDIKEQFGSLYDEWAARQEKLGPSVGLFFGARSHMGIYAENRFVNLIWGLESLHRGVFLTEGKTPLEIKSTRILEQIVTAGIFKGTGLKFIKSQLGKRFEPHLALRIKECITELKLPFELKELEVFCDRCASIRNDISHFGGRRPGAVYQSLINEIILKTEAVAILYRAVLLREMGLSCEALTKIFEKGRFAYQLRRTFEDAGLKLAPIKAETDIA